MARNNKNDRPISYPKPTETDVQLQNQPEYIDQQPNTREKDISNMPVDNDTPQNDENTRDTE